MRVGWRCVNGPGFVSGAINFISRGPVCHTEPIFEGAVTIGGKAYAGVSIGAHADGGVQVRALNRYPVDHRFYAEVTDAQYAAGLEFLAAQIGKPYNFPGIGDILIAHAITRDWRDNKSWFCSEETTAWLEVMGLIKPLDVPINLITPTDVLIFSSAMFGAQ